MISKERLKYIETKVADEWLDPVKIETVIELLEALNESMTREAACRKALIDAELAISWCVCECVQHRGVAKDPVN